MIEALIAAGVTLFVCLINNYYQQKKVQTQHDETMNLMSYKLDQLTKKVELHNNAVERIYALERITSVHEEKLKVSNHRLDDLEHHD